MTQTSRVQPGDAEIEAIVAEAIAAEASLAQSEAHIPSSAIVWWRAQMRARQEAARMAERPIAIVHSLSIAAGMGLMLSVAGYAAAGIRGSAAWAANALQSIGAAAGALPALSLASPWLPLALSVMLVTALVAFVAAYLIFADE